MTESPPEPPTDTPPASPTREELEQRLGEARASINQTVEQIKGTVEEQVDAVTDTVSGVVSLGEKFQSEPVAWSLGALSAGFAMGYSLGRAHAVKSRNGRPSKLARYADDLASELASFGGALVPPNLSADLKSAFGVDLTAALARIAAVEPARPWKRRAARKPKTTVVRAAKPRAVAKRTAARRSKRRRRPSA